MDLQQSQNFSTLILLGEKEIKVEDWTTKNVGFWVIVNI